MSLDATEEAIDILLVEDNPGDVRLTEMAFEAARLRNELATVGRGAEALEYLHQRGAYEDVDRPDIVLLDLNLPEMGGQELLREIRDTPELELIPVIILTSSSDDEQIAEGYRGRANAYLTKPIDVDEFVDLARSIGDFWIRMVELPPDHG